MSRQQSTRQGPTNNNVNVVRRDTALRELDAQMDNRMAILQDSAASLIDPVRLKGIILSTFTRTPSLWDCDPLSIARAVVEAAQVGLTPTGSLGGAYLVPFNNRETGKKEAQLIIAYTGLVQLARRSGAILKVEARIVRKQDEFDFGYGLVPYLDHKPARGVPEDAENPMTDTYAVATFKSGETQFDVMSAAEVLAIRARSKAKDSGPWVTDEAEMWKKTVLRRLAKLLPLTVEAQRILDVEDDLDREARTPAARPQRVATGSRIAARVIGHGPNPEQPEPSGGEAASTGDVESGTAPTPSPDDSAADDAAAQVSEDGSTSDTCGSPSPYDEDAECVREAGHPQNVMCRDAGGTGTWPRPEDWA